MHMIFLDNHRFLPHDPMLAQYMLWLLSVCVCMCVTSWCSTKMVWADFGMEASFDASTYPTLCYNEIRVAAKIRVLPSETLSQTLDLENFATASRSLLGVLSVKLTDGRSYGYSRFIDCITDGRRACDASTYHTLTACSLLGLYVRPFIVMQHLHSDFGSWVLWSW